MKLIRSTAFVVSVHYEDSKCTLRVNLKWQGNHDISAFDLDRLGKVVHCETEAEDTGWVVIEPYNRLNTYPRGLLPPFWPSTPEPSFFVSPGAAIPFIYRGPPRSHSPH